MQWPPTVYKSDQTMRCTMKATIRIVKFSAQNNKLPMRLPATNTTTRRKMIDFILISQRHVRPQTKYKQKTVGTSVRAGESKQCANVRENDKDTTQRCASSSLPQHSRAPFPSVVLAFRCVWRSSLLSLRNSAAKTDQKILFALRSGPCPSVHTNPRLRDKTRVAMIYFPPAGQSIVLFWT